MSPVTREKKIAYTAANPNLYPDDDIFGYMRAAKIEVTDSETGKVTKENVTLTRVSPLKNSAFMAVAYNPIVQNWSSMTRQDGDAVPYGIDEYCAVMKGMFSVDLDQVGTFSMMNKSGFMNINESLKNEMLESDAREIDDSHVKDAKGNPLKLVRLTDKVRNKRVKDTIAALKYLAGGAKQTTNMADVTPKLIVLAMFNSANHPFSHLAKDDLGKAVFSVDALKQVLNDYGDQLDGKVYIGRRMGFMDGLEDKLAALSEEFPSVVDSVNGAIDAFVETIQLEN